MVTTANNFLNNDIIAKAALASFKNNLSLAMTANIQFRQEFEAGRGDTLRIDKPVRYTVREGAKAELQGIQEECAVMRIAYQDGIDVHITSKQRTLDLRSFNNTVLDPAMKKLANKVDCRGIEAGLATIYHTVGMPNEGVNFAVVNEARAMLNKIGTEGEYLVMNYDNSTSLQNSLQNAFNSQLNKSISERACIGRLANLDVYDSANLHLHTVGEATGKPVVLGGAVQPSGSLNTQGWSAKKTVLKQGDILYIDGVYAVNPLTQQPIGAGEKNLQRFIVTADAMSDEKGNASVMLSPKMILDGAYQNVSQAPADGAAIHVYGTAGQTFNNNFAYGKDAFSLACVRLEEPRGAGFAKTLLDRETGLSIRMVEDYDLMNDVNKIRFDVMYGWLCNPEYAVRLVG